MNLLLDHDPIEKNAQFNGQPAAHRVVHAQGAGAAGFFEVIEDVSQFTMATVFQQHTRTDTLIRFSPVTGEPGSPDAWRDPRGAAIRLHTVEGNFDLIVTNSPVFFLRDPTKVPEFLRSQEPRADEHPRDLRWDFWSRNPASAHQVTWLMGDRGIPRSWRTMNLYGAHAFRWVNSAEETFWVKYHLRTDQGHAFLTQADADRIAGADADFLGRDLRTAINRGEHPSWTLYVQVMPYSDAADYRFNPFDVTKVWPHADYPLLKVGRLVLNHNPGNDEPEPAAFGPLRLIPGLGHSPDKMLRARLSPDASDAAITGLDEEILRSAEQPHTEDDDFGQPGTLVRKVFTDEQRDRFVSAVAGQLSGVSKQVLDRSVDYLRKVDKSIGDRIANDIPEYNTPNDNPKSSTV